MLFPSLELKKLEAIFRHNVLRMLLSRGKITHEMMAMLSTWRHSSFNVFCGNRISPTDDTAIKSLRMRKKVGADETVRH